MLNQCTMLSGQVRTGRAFLLISQLLLFWLIATPVAATSIRELLRPDGTVNLKTGFTGSVDVSGFGVVLDPQRGPVFRPQALATNWSALGTGLSGNAATVTALAVIGSDLYVGGYFSTAGDVSVNNIAKWNGTTWSALGTEEANGVTGSNVQVYALAVIGNNLYVGGIFETAGGTTIEAINVAKWNGSNWSALGEAFDNEVRSMAVIGTNLYVGGSFSHIGETEVNYIAKCNVTSASTSWSALVDGVTPGVNNPVTALAVSGTALYAGGNFSKAGTIDVNNIAKWSGTSWSALGTGVDGDVYALAVLGSDLYAGGVFNNAGNVPANKIAKWNGSTWSALGSGESNGISGDWQVNALAVIGTDLYVGGEFDNAGGEEVDNIAKWNGTTSTWSALESGLSNRVDALAVLGGNLYAGGTFTGSGALELSRIAKWTVSETTPCAVTVSITAVPSTTITSGGSVTLTASGADSYTWSTGESTTAITVSPTSSTAFSVTGTTGSCSATASVAISVTQSTPSNSATVCVAGGCTIATGTYIESDLSSAPIAVNRVLINSSKGAYMLHTPAIDEGGNDISYWQIYVLSQGLSYTAAGTNPATIPLTGWEGNPELQCGPITVSMEACSPAPVCDPSLIADAISVTQTAVLSPDNCAVMLTGKGYGTGYVITGPNGYVFSAVYRKVGSYTINGLNVTQPGTYTLNVSYTDACGQSTSDTMTYIVTGTACK